MKKGNLYMPILYYMVGFPGSGKSTYAHKYLADAVYIGSDTIREELYSDEAVQCNHAHVFSVAKERAVAALTDGKNVVMDSTGLLKADRERFLADLPEGTLVEMVVLHTSLHTCIDRNEARDRVVPRSRMFAMKRAYVEPTNDECGCIRHVLNF